MLVLLVPTVLALMLMEIMMALSVNLLRQLFLCIWLPSTSDNYQFLKGMRRLVENSGYKLKVCHEYMNRGDRWMQVSSEIQLLVFHVALLIWPFSNSNLLKTRYIVSLDSVPSISCSFVHLNFFQFQPFFLNTIYFTSFYINVNHCQSCLSVLNKINQNIDQCLCF